MDDALFVRGFHGFGDLLRDRQGVRQGHRSLRDPISERRSFDELHHERVRVAAVFETVHVRDVRMVQRSEHLRLAAESRETLRITGKRSRQDFERDVAVQFLVAGAVDLAHASGADEADDLVWANSCSRGQGHETSSAWARGPTTSIGVGPHPHAARLVSLRSLAGPRAPVPPAPMRPTISYGPIRAPAVRAMKPLRHGLGGQQHRSAWGPAHAARLVSLRSLAGPQAPMPPAPMMATISYEPICVPELSGMWGILRQWSTGFSPPLARLVSVVGGLQPAARELR